MTTLSITPTKRGKWLLATDTFRDEVNLDKQKERRRVARELGVSGEWLFACFQSAELTNGGQYEIPNESADFTLHVQSQFGGAGIKAGGSSAEGIIKSAIEYSGVLPPNPIIKWDGADKCCAVDCDWHAFDFEHRPSAARLAVIARSIRPSPRVCWVTHGRGLRLIYFANSRFPADELAAVAVVSLSKLDQTATAELKTDTRHPAYPLDGRECGSVTWMTADEDVASVTLWMKDRTAEAPDVTAWLQGRGFEIGKRYDHDKCPVEPNEKGGRQPVSVHEMGIFCYACAGRGIRRGSRSAGWFPYSIFVGRPSDATVGVCVRNLTHWTHARHILAAHYDLSEGVLEKAYAALLRHVHDADSRLPRVFSAGQTLVRYDGFWGSIAGEPYGRNVEAMLATLPVTQYVVDGETKVSPAIVAELAQPSRHTGRGYPPLVPVWGIRIHGHRLSPKYPYTILLQRGENPPHYVKGGNLEEAWRKIEAVFPGVCRNVVDLLIAAKGCAEADGTFPPFIFLTGPTGSAKTTSVTLAAAICGDRTHSIPLVSNDERIRAALLEAKEKGSFAVFNEAMKGNQKWKTSKTEAMEFALSLTPDSVSHKLYVGPVRLGRLPVCIWTDTAIPAEVKTNAQLARRIIHARLPNKVDWHTSVREAGLGKAEYLRTWRDLAEAADVIVSSVIDRFFSYPMTIEDIAGQLGFGTLADSEDAADGNDTLVQFFKAVCGLPAISGADAARWSGSGWKVFQVDAETDVARLWREVADRDLTSSQRIAEVDWQKLLSARCPTECQLKVRGRRVAVRFTEVGKRQTPLTNGELVGTIPTMEEVPETLSLGKLDI